MDEWFARGHRVLKFFESLLDPGSYSRLMEDPLHAGIALLAVLLVLVLGLKRRKARLERRHRLQELEQALMDEDLEDRDLGLPKTPPELDDEEYSSVMPRVSRSGVLQDPSLESRIVIGPDSQRKHGPSEPEEPEEPAPSPAESFDEAEIEAEFAKFAEELKQKQLKVKQRHEAPASSPLEPAAEGGAPADPLDIPSLSDDELEGLLQLDSPEESALELPPEIQAVEEYDALEAEMAEAIQHLQEEVADDGLEPELTAVMEDQPTEDRKKRERLIHRLEEFQRDLEHRFQSRTLENLAQRNLELVETLRRPDGSPEHETALREKQNALHTLETLMFPQKTDRS